MTHVCVTNPAIPPGAIASKGIIMINTLRNMERIHRVIATGRTENATPTPYQQKTGKAGLLINRDVYLVAMFVMADR